MTRTWQTLRGGGFAVVECDGCHRIGAYSEGIHVPAAASAAESGGGRGFGAWSA